MVDGRVGYSPENVGRLVEPNRVHRDVYISPEVFEMEMRNIWSRSWIYVGHESQVKNPGDYFATEMARQPVVMVRQNDGSIGVVHNRCAHKGAEIVTTRTGNVKYFYCNYHGWTFRLDGTLASVPLREGYQNTCFDFDNPNFHLQKVARVDQYRGFVFASLADDGPDLKTFLGPAAEAFDDLIERSPINEVEVIGTCARTVQHSNWKLFMENQLDAVHAGIVHHSSAAAAKKIAEKNFNDKDVPPEVMMLSQQTPPDPKSVFVKLNSASFPYGHSYFMGYIPSRGHDPEIVEYERQMKETLGEAEAERRLSRNFHHTIVYPSLSIQSTFGQVRVIKPQAENRTVMDIWHFRLMGVDRAFEARRRAYSNTVNSPATIISCDDYETWWRCQQGLHSSAFEWVSLDRNYGDDVEENGVWKSRIGTSEVFQRHQYAVWKDYMTGAI